MKLSWRRLPNPVIENKPKRSSLRLAIIGNCQALALQKCIEAITRDVTATAGEICRLAATPEELDLSAVLADNDILMVQPGLRNLIDTKYAHERDRIFFFPSITFAAYHPDIVYIYTPGKTFLRGPLGDYNSSIVFYGWKKGMEVSRILELFCEEVYRKLGFLDYWQSSQDALLKEAKMCGWPLDDLLKDWVGRGCFMHTINHPKFFTLAELARRILTRFGVSTNPIAEGFIYDYFLENAVWPVYPEIGQGLGIKGYYLFKKPRCLCPADRPVVMLDIEEFVSQSLESLSHYGREELVCERLNSAPYKELELFTGKPASPRGAWGAQRQNRPPGSAGRSPYDGLADFHFWRKAVSRVAPHEVDPVFPAGFTIDRADKVATAGSCFAQHISGKLHGSGFNYYVAEKPAGLCAEEARRLGYCVFSARYGNIYTARQLLQLFDRAFGTFTPCESAWRRADGRFVDPFRPRIEPEGFRGAEEVENARRDHLFSVREMFKNLDVFVFTLGLTEGWKSKEDGAVFPLAPGVAAGEMDFSLYEFVNFRASEVTRDIEVFIDRLWEVNPKARIIFTVSPVPLIATYEDRHVLVSTTYSKSVLRVSAEEVVRSHRNCFYFPAYEIITGNFTRGAYYESDLRSVNSKGVDHAMRLFFAHCSNGKEGSPHYETLLREAEALQDIICDEEQIDLQGVPVP